MGRGLLQRDIGRRDGVGVSSGLGGAFHRADGSTRRIITPIPGVPPRCMLQLSWDLSISQRCPMETKATIYQQYKRLTTVTKCQTPVYARMHAL